MLINLLTFLVLIEGNDEFVCHQGKQLPSYYHISEVEAEERKCCIDLPCKYEQGCWSGLQPPLYSSPRSQGKNISVKYTSNMFNLLLAITEDEAHKIEDSLLLPLIRSGELVKTSVSSMPNHSWWRGKLFAIFTAKCLHTRNTSPQFYSYQYPLQKTRMTFFTKVFRDHSEKHSMPSWKCLLWTWIFSISTTSMSVGQVILLMSHFTQEQDIGYIMIVPTLEFVTKRQVSNNVQT